MRGVRGVLQSGLAYAFDLILDCAQAERAQTLSTVRNLGAHFSMGSSRPMKMEMRLRTFLLSHHILRDLTLPEYQNTMFRNCNVEWYPPHA